MVISFWVLYAICMVVGIGLFIWANSLIKDLKPNWDFFELLGWGLPIGATVAMGGTLLLLYFTDDVHAVSLTFPSDVSTAASIASVLSLIWIFALIFNFAVILITQCIFLKRREKKW